MCPREYSLSALRFKAYRIFFSALPGKFVQRVCSIFSIASAITVISSLSYLLVVLLNVIPSPAAASVFAYNTATGDTHDWSVFYAQGTVPPIVFRHDPVLRQQIMVINGAIRKDLPPVDGNLQRNGSHANTQALQYQISWRISTASRYRVSVIVDTLSGPRELVYSVADATTHHRSRLKHVFKLDKQSINGQWVDLSRNLSADLFSVEPGNRVRGLLRLEVAGSLKFAGFSVDRWVSQHSGPAPTPAQEPETAPVEQRMPITQAEESTDSPPSQVTPEIASALPLNPVRSWVMRPYLVAARNSYNRDNKFEEESNYVGVSASYTGQIINFHTEIYPDFSLVDQQLSDISFSYDEKKKKDSRPFFRGDETFFGDESDYFYSLRVPDFNVGVKSTLNSGANKAGVLMVSSPDERQDMHAHYRFGATKHFRLTLDTVASRQQNFEHQLMGATLKDRFANDLFYHLKGAISQQENDQNDEVGTTLSLKAGWNPGRWTFSYTSDRYATEYNPANALIKKDLPGTRGSSATIAYYSAGLVPFANINADFTLNRRDTLNDETQNSGIYTSTSFELLSHARLSLSYNNYTYRQAGEEPGEFLDETSEDQYWAADVDMNINSARFGYGLSMADGNLAGGEYKYLSGYAWFKPHKKLNLKLSRERLVSFGEYKQASVRGSWKFQRNHSLHAVFNQGDEYKQFRFAYNYSLPGGQDVFLGFHRLTDAKDEFVGKFVWTIQ